LSHDVDTAADEKLPRRPPPSIFAAKTRPVAAFCGFRRGKAIQIHHARTLKTHPKNRTLHVRQTACRERSVRLGRSGESQIASTISMAGGAFAKTRVSRQNELRTRSSSTSMIPAGRHARRAIEADGPVRKQIALPRLGPGPENGAPGEGRQSIYECSRHRMLRIWRKSGRGEIASAETRDAERIGARKRNTAEGRAWHSSNTTIGKPMSYGSGPVRPYACATSTSLHGFRLAHGIDQLDHGHRGVESTLVGTHGKRANLAARPGRTRSRAGRGDLNPGPHKRRF